MAREDAETSGMEDLTSLNIAIAWPIHLPAASLKPLNRKVALAMSAPHRRKASPPSPSHSTSAMWALRSSPTFLMAAAATLSLSLNAPAS
ncbi:hypothetical protein [Streptomyces cinnamoneus]|uniref:hypothetical protein n=1 Tax=Streptomyces cinnamoneus TaxID=53446 RepID=UPI003797CB7B